jgi:type IV pilus assembly protein PilY1
VADKNRNGRWFVVFGSGPTGPVGTGQQFMGSSDQPARLFFIDLKNGPTDGNFWEYTFPVNNAFVGSLLNANEDVDIDYQDDVVYIPYVYKSALGTTWTQGGIARLLTREDLDGTNFSGSGDTALNPANWTVNTVIDGTGPVTSAVARLQNQRKGQLWLFGGTGRYYYEYLGTTDDPTNRRHIFGVKDPCYSTAGFDFACAATTTKSFGDLVNVTAIANVPANPDATGYNGWSIALDTAGSYPYYEDGAVITRNYMAERVITDPLATTSGVVFFTTYKPYDDQCSLGGKSFLWATKYDTGGYAGALLKGKALVQVSTGSIEQVDLSSAFSEEGGRKSYSMEGVPPTAQGLSILSTPPPVKKVLHIRER